MQLNRQLFILPLFPEDTLINYIMAGVKSKIVCKLPRLLNSSQPDTQ